MGSWLAILLFAGHALAACTTLPPFPSGATCGQSGKLLSPPESNAGEQSGSIATCAGWCYNDPSCNAFSRNSVKGTCRFYAGSDWKSTYEYKAEASSNDDFYSVTCFSCASKQCPPASNTNLFDNGDFQLSNTYLGPWVVDSGADALADTSIVSPGRLSTRAASCDGSCQISQTRSLCSGQYYLFSFAFQIQSLVDDPPRHFHRLGVGWNIPNGGSFDRFYKRPIRGSKWVRTATSFKATSDEYDFNPGFVWEHFSPQDRHAFRVLWDNFVLKAIADPQTLPTTGNSLLSSNSGFDQGSLASWDVTPPFLVEANVTFPSPGLPAPDGTQSQHKFRLDTTNNYDSGSNSYYGYYFISQRLPMPTNTLKYYKFSFSYRANNVSGITIFFDNYRRAGEYIWVEQAPENGKVYEFIRIVPGTGWNNSIAIDSSFAADSEHSSIELDNFSFKEVTLQ